MLELIHTSTLAWFGWVQYEKTSVNSPTTKPNQTEPARSIQPGWHGTIQLLLRPRIKVTIIAIATSVLVQIYNAPLA